MSRQTQEIFMNRDPQEKLSRAGEERPEWLKLHGKWIAEDQPGQWSKEHLESLRLAAQIAKQHEHELLVKLAEVAECYSAVKRARFHAEERYREAIRTN